MGLKFKKFKAKLDWKTKEPPPEIVCLRYQIFSEFSDQIRVPIPESSTTQVRINNVKKIKKPALKPPIQGVFESSTASTINPASTTMKSSTSNSSKPTSSSTPSSSTPTPSTTPSSFTPAPSSTPNFTHNTKPNENQNTTGTTSKTAPAKGILKKSTPDETVVEEPKWNQNEEAHSDDYNKSALIFMTENHGDGEEACKPDQEIPKPNVKPAPYQEIETGELTFNDKSKQNEDVTYRNRSDSESDVKTVRWRETVMEINPPVMNDRPKSEPSEDDFKVHFVKHTNVSQPADAEAEESESEEGNQPQVDLHNQSRGAYSSQAASIFFAGEEPEPALRLRNVAATEDDDNNVAGGGHSNI